VAGDQTETTQQIARWRQRLHLGVQHVHKKPRSGSYNQHNKRDDLAEVRMRQDDRGNGIRASGLQEQGMQE